MRITSILMTLICSSDSVLGQVEFEWAHVGDPGNRGDRISGLGAVDYEFLISKHEVTNEQYAEFLNHVAAVDPHELFVERMRIQREGTSGNFRYSPAPGFEKHPVTHIRFFDAMRFVNWLENGQTFGGTEDGVYSVDDGSNETRNDKATYFIPSENEWHKAAYYDPTLNNGTGGYWRWATQSNVFPTSQAPPGDSNSVNTGEAKLGGPTEVGAYRDSTSYYGTYDQLGNLWEWIDKLDEAHPHRNIRGTAWSGSPTNIRIDIAAKVRSNGVSDIGFRIARRVETFRRGDCNSDSTFDISDPIYALRSLFLGQGEPICGDACDANDDGEITLTDSILAMEILFSQQSPLVSPGSIECGIDPTDDEMRCEFNLSCH